MGTKISITLSDNTTRVYQDDQVVEANIFEANDPLCLKLESATLECVLYSATDEFNVLNPNGIVGLLKQKQKISISYVFEDSTEVQIGVYYLASWNLESDQKLRIVCMDALYLLESYTYILDFPVVESTDILVRPVGKLFYYAGIIDNERTIGDYASGGNPRGIENGGYLTCRYPRIVNSRELISNICAQYSCSFIMRPDGIPYFFESSETQYGSAKPRPEINTPILRDRIVSNTSAYEVPSKIRSIILDKYVGYTYESEEKLYQETLRGHGSKEIYMKDNSYGNYTIENLTSGTDISLFYRGVVSFTYTFSGSTSKVVTLKGHRIKNMYDTKEKVYASNGNDIVEIRNTLGNGEPIDLWFNRWNNGLIANVKFIMNSDMTERAGTKLKIELEPNKLYTGVITELNIDITGGLIAEAKILCQKEYEVINGGV